MLSKWSLAIQTPTEINIRIRHKRIFVFPLWFYFLIQMKAPQQYSPMVFFVFQYFT